MAIKVAHTTVK